MTSTPKAGARECAPLKYELVVSEWRGSLHCIYLNDHRIAGGKPWGGGKTAVSWKIRAKDLMDAVPELRAPVDRAELERLREALQQIANGDGTYGAQAHEYKQTARAALKGESQ